MRKRTRSSLRAVAATLVAGFLAASGAEAQPPAEAPTQPLAQAPELLEPSAPNPAAAVFDVLVVRPLGLVVLPVGVAAFIPAALLTAPNGKESLLTALDLFVTGPANYVFQRPLGEF